MDLIDKSKNETLAKLCEYHQVKELYFFGSVLTDHFKESSDIDMLVQFNPMNVDLYFDNYIGLKEKLELLFTRPIDLVENQAIKNPVFRKVIDREKLLIYERKSA